MPSKKSNRGPFVELKPAAPVLEGFVLQTARAGQRRKAREAVTRVLGGEWKVAAFGDAGTDYEATPAAGGRSRLSAARAWEKTYRLRSQPGVIYAEPTFAVPVSAPPEFRPEAGEGGRAPLEGEAFESVVRTRDLPESDDPQWSIREVKIPEAWKLFPAGAGPGAQVLVGHPDTGYSLHPENVARLLTQKGHDFVKGDADAKDDLDSGLLLFPGHGTGTASVIISPPDAQGDFTVDGRKVAVWGAAPGAQLIPFRVSRSVVLDVPWAGGGVGNLAKAIELAADRGAHVVSISMGTGFPSSRLLKAVRHAQKLGVIVAAAAGNFVGFVVWPAAYEEVVAVAASNARRQTWAGSSRGSAVDVTAPGESVWCAGAARGEKYTVGRGSGTSFAVATVAGVAALWLSRHGRDKLVRRYGAEKIPVIFNQLLRDTCDPVPEWGAGFGRGLVNAARLLAAPLPGPSDPLPNAEALLREHPALDAGGLATFRHLFETALPRGRGELASAGDDGRLLARLAELLGVGEEEAPARLKEVGQELAFHLAADPALYLQFAASVSGGRPRAAELGAPAAGTDGVRAALLAKPTSTALKKRLAGGT